jgi:hypothetical protein
MKDLHDDHLFGILVEIKRLQDLIEDAVEWNFGRAPNEPWFHKCTADRNHLLDVLKEKDFETYRNLVDELFGG